MFSSDFEERLYKERQEKLKHIEDLGIKTGLMPLEATYPNRFPKEEESDEPEKKLDSISAVQAEYNNTDAPVTAEALEADRVEVAVAGRVMAHRRQGKAGFAVLQGNGSRLQIYVRRDDVGERAFELYKLLDLGDHIGVTGYLFRTRTGELTVHVQTLTFLAKAMLALPDKFHGLTDIELRYRQRYLDLFMDNGEDAVESVVEPDEPGAPPSPQAKAGSSAEGAPNNPEALAAATAGLKRLPARDVFVKRAQILKALRTFFDARGYIEVETPMMQPVAGGAAARPFVTHHNTMDMDLYLRIAPELYLKRLVVGGMDRVYEINRNFRNEGISTQHNPEFTMLEFYQAYSNYHDLMDLTEELITFVANKVNGTTLIDFPLPKGPRAGNLVQIDLGKWRRLSMKEAIYEWWPAHLPVLSEAVFSDSKSLSLFLEGAKKVHESQDHFARFEERTLVEVTEDDIRRQELAPPEPNDDPLILTLMLGRIVYQLDNGMPLGKAISDLFEVVAEQHLIQPTIIYDFPLDVSPLSKLKTDVVKQGEIAWVERFEFYIGGFEVGNAFSELNDPEDQRRRFEAQLGERERGDEEAHQMDADYVRALAYGLPPTAGEGIGIDRLTMLLTGSRSIRDVILFPLLRPAKQPVLEKTEEQSNPAS